MLYISVIIPFPEDILNANLCLQPSDHMHPSASIPHRHQLTWELSSLTLYPSPWYEMCLYVFSIISSNSPMTFNQSSLHSHSPLSDTSIHFSQSSSATRRHLLSIQQPANVEESANRQFSAVSSDKNVTLQSKGSAAGECVTQLRDIVTETGSGVTKCWTSMSWYCRQQEKLALCQAEKAISSRPISVEWIRQ